MKFFLHARNESAREKNPLYLDNIAKIRRNV